MTAPLTRPEHLSTEISKEGYAQNLGKAELLPRPHGAGSHLVLEEMNSLEDHPLQARVVMEARHSPHRKSGAESVH